MGSLTRDQLLTAGQGKMGNLSTALTTRLQVEFQAWLDRQYQSWSWPFLKRRATALTLAASTTSVTVGNGIGGITDSITRIISPFAVYTSDLSTVAKADIVESVNSSTVFDEVLNPASKQTGLPIQFKAVYGTVRGQWDLKPLPTADKAYLMAIDYFMLPAAVTGSSIPIYPGDATMIQAIAALGLVDQKGVDSAAAQTAMGYVGAMIDRDRAMFGQVMGENDIIMLDLQRFR